jgi:peptidoglycan hydrolase FlgJ
MNLLTGVPDPAQPHALDAGGLERLRAQARREPGSALKAAAREFEALFTHMLLKSMRETIPREGLLQSEQTRLYTSMLDQQFAQILAGRGLGLAETMVKQLSHAVAGAGSAVAALPARPPAENPATTPVEREPAPAAAPAAATGSAKAATPEGGSAISRAREFVNRVWTHAVEASRATGIPPQFMVGQAALESGWGRREIRTEEGAPSYNLFGIKAGRGWTGPVALAATTEYVNGVAGKTVERFRAYASYAEAFRDYANLLRKEPRYAAVLERAQDAAGFARGLQQAGYATDPMYAEKLLRILNGSLLRQGLTG